MRDSAQYINGSVDLTGWTVITSGDDFTEAIYNSVKNSYSVNTLLISTFDILLPEKYYVNLMPGISGLEFSDITVYNNVIVLQCNYTNANTSFIGEEIAVEFALVNGTDVYLTDSEKELKNKVTELAEQLKVMVGDSNTSGQGGTSGSSGAGSSGTGGSSINGTGNNVGGNSSGVLGQNPGQGILDEYETIKSIHDYLVKNIVYTYSSGIGNGTDAKADQKLRSALFQHQCVCAGYAKSFYFLCKATGLDVVYVTGTATDGSGSSESHAWNKVKIGDKWYAIDVTWDDPLVYDPDTGTSHDGGEQVVYNYFLITDSDMSYNHTWSDNGLPTADSTDLGIIYQQYASTRKFTNDSDALSYVRGELEAYCTDHSPRLSGFEFEITVLSSDGDTLYDDLWELVTYYHSNYGCGGGVVSSDAGFYGEAFNLRIYY